MTIPTSESLINAAADTDLALRFVALGATLGYTQGDIESNLRKLVAAQFNANGDTVASVYDYAYQVRKQAEAEGLEFEGDGAEPSIHRALRRAVQRPAGRRDGG